jgi:hypothetical protein
VIFYYEDKEPSGIGLPHSHLEYQHKGFAIRKSPGFQLYSIVVPPGKRLVRELNGDFTQQLIIQEKIDNFLAGHTFEEAFSDVEAAPKRGRPTNEELLKRAQQKELDSQKIKTWEDTAYDKDRTG